MMKMVMIVRWRTLRMRTITFRCILLQKKGFFFHIIIILIYTLRTYPIMEFVLHTMDS